MAGGHTTPAPDTALALVEGARAALLRELAPGLLHELSNPVTAILGLAQLLRVETGPGAKAAERLAMIEQCGLELRDLVSVLTELAGPGGHAGGTPSLERAVADAVALVRRAGPSPDVEIVEHYASAGTPVALEPARARQAVLHLLANAARAVRDGGTVTVEVARDDGRAVVVVADTGEGIAPDVLPHVFEPFYTTRSVEGGVGLGLPAARLIAEAAGGDLELTSAPGAGTAATLSLPTGEPAA